MDSGYLREAEVYGEETVPKVGKLVTAATSLLLRIGLFPIHDDTFLCCVSVLSCLRLLFSSCVQNSLEVVSLMQVLQFTSEP